MELLVKASPVSNVHQNRSETPAAGVPLNAGCHWILQLRSAGKVGVPFGLQEGRMKGRLWCGRWRPCTQSLLATRQWHTALAP